MVVDEEGSVRAVIAVASSRLSGAGIPEPRREARQILESLRPDRGPGSGIEDPSTIGAETAAEYARRVARRAAGEPLAYVTGSTGFRYLELRSDRRALIPRPETEGLVELVLQRVPAGSVADIGTGSGCIALSLAREGIFTRILAVDRSAAALELAGENARLTGGLVRFVRGDLATALAPESCDALVSNPPYLSVSEYASLDTSVREWEPAEALASGDDGLTATRALLDDARRVVRTGGWLALEVDCSRAATAARCATVLGWRDVAIHTDLFGRERYLLARRSAE